MHGGQWKSSILGDHHGADDDDDVHEDVDDDDDDVVHDDDAAIADADDHVNVCDVEFAPTKPQLSVPIA